MDLPDHLQAATLLEELLDLRQAMEQIEHQEAETLRAVDPVHRPSARNLLHFLSFCDRTSPRLAKRLRERGLSSLAGCEGYLMAELDAVIAVLARLEGRADLAPARDPVAPPVAGRHEGRERMRGHREHLLGRPATPDSATIMVTLPTEAADDPNLIRELVEAGMTIARINCAHDGPEVWRAFVEQVLQAQRETGRRCRIAMDLAGPKLRTGTLPFLPGVIRARPRRDRYGRLVRPARIRALPAADEALPLPEGAVHLPIVNRGWQDLRPGQRLHGHDASGRRRELVVEACDRSGLWLRTDENCRFTAGQVFTAREGGAQVVVADLPPAPGELMLHAGDRLRLTAADTPAPDAVPCTLPDVFGDVRPGERILFDDGRIGGVVRAVSPEELQVEITAARPRGSRLRSDKGINLPDSDLHTPALTAKDLRDLGFATAHADLVSYSFVHRPEDVAALHRALACRGRSDLGVVLKIETRRAFERLPRLLLAAMRYPAPFGVMIARGDLAIECGWDALAEIQEEILRICEAAHVPCIWATQVLEEMARHGMPTRA
ncbi:MAG: pyruvate kinase, partial [Synechococcaceae cyanobacterium]|nr:pyruvate kinase [Synechococcaceae cyanobacterium]